MNRELRIVVHDVRRYTFSIIFLTECMDLILYYNVRQANGFVQMYLLYLSILCIIYIVYSIRAHVHSKFNRIYNICSIFSHCAFTHLVILVRVCMIQFEYTE